MRTNRALDRVGAHPIAAIQQTARDMEAAGRALIDFSIGDPREPTWPAIPEAVREAVPAVSQYPTTKGLPELRRAVAGYVYRRLGVEIDPETQVIPTSGAKEAIFTAALAFVDRDRGDAVGFPDPAYPVYARGAVLAGARALPVAANDGFVVTAAEVERSGDLTMMWVCTPSNPTGAVTSAAELEALVDGCRVGDTLLCSDECYLDLYDPGESPPASVLQAAGPGSEGVLAFLSLSKRSGMTGYRSGAVVGDATAIERLHRLRTSTGTASPEFVQAGAIAAWDDDDHVAERRRIFAEKRQILGEFFERRGAEVGGATAGLYLWVGAGGDDIEVAQRLLESGVVVTPGSVFGARGVGYLRLALVPTIPECRQAVTRLAQIW